MEWVRESSENCKEWWSYDIEESEDVMTLAVAPHTAISRTTFTNFGFADPDPGWYYRIGDTRYQGPYPDADAAKAVALFIYRAGV